MSEERTNADILRAARARISDQRHFVMGAYAWDRRGREIDATSSDAVRWNPRGAIYAESGIRPTETNNTRAGTIYGILDAAAFAVGDTHGVRFPAGTDVSDNLGHALALQALDGAIALALEAESGVLG